MVVFGSKYSNKIKFISLFICLTNSLVKATFGWEGCPELPSLRSGDSET